MSGVVIVDLGSGNLHSVSRAVARVSAAAPPRIQLTAEPATIAAADHLILPGQGAIGAWLAQLDAHPGLRAALLARLQADRGPVLGICLGLEVLYAHSEEDGGAAGFGLLPGTVRHFAARRGFPPRLKIPHMGWNRVRHTRHHPLWRGIADNERFYFVHSYYAAAAPDQAEVVGETDYGGAFTAAAARGNLFATQFHPEKSQRAGLQLLRNFVNWDGKW